MISFDRVSKVYPRTTRAALDDVTLTIERGEFVFLVGASGSGKSTLLRLVLREETATTGRVAVAGRELDRMRARDVPALRRTIGCVFQDFRLLPGRSAADNVAFALQVVGGTRRWVRNRVHETLEEVGLSDVADRMPHELSGGEQQRVAIARALANKPTILLADEPTGNLDPTTSLDVVDLLDRINRRRGTTVVMATHDDEIVDALRKRVVELDAGRLVRDEEHGSYGLGRTHPTAYPTHDVEESYSGRHAGATRADLLGTDDEEPLR